MFFFGFFSTLLPYIIIAALYAVFMITLSVEKFHQDKTLQQPEAKELHVDFTASDYSPETIHYYDAYANYQKANQQLKSGSLTCSFFGAEYRYPGQPVKPPLRENFDYSLYPIPPPFCRNFCFKD